MTQSNDVSLGKQQPVSILFFKGSQCAPCKVVERHLLNIIKSAGANAAKLTTIDTDHEIDLVDKYLVTNVPEVYFNDTKVLSAQEASDLLATGDLEQSLMGTSEDSSQPMNIFSQGQNAIFNHLFNRLIHESIKSDELGRETWDKLSLFILSEKSIRRTDKLTRTRIGDYVHIGALQSIILSILSLSPNDKYLFEAGKRLGTTGTPQMRFINENPEILELSRLDHKKRFKKVMKALKNHFNYDSSEYPTYISTKARYSIRSADKAILKIYDSAYSSGVPQIGSPVCHLLAGEIAGLLETTLGTYASVEETKCPGLNEKYDHCEFLITLLDEPEAEIKSADLEVQASAVFSQERKDRCALAIDKIAQNMYNSSLLRDKLRECGDYVHISVFQHVITAIKFLDPFYGTLLYYAGLHQGRQGQDFEVVERIAKESNIDLPCEFKEGCKLMNAYYNDPTTILSRNKAFSKIEVHDEETATLRIHECATASGLILQSEDVKLFPSEIKPEDIFLCDYTAGFITGRLNKLLDWEVRVTETGCQSKGLPYCEFRIELD